MSYSSPYYSCPILVSKRRRRLHLYKQKHIILIQSINLCIYRTPCSNHWIFAQIFVGRFHSVSSQFYFHNSVHIVPPLWKRRLHSFICSKLLCPVWESMLRAESIKCLQPASGQSTWISCPCMYVTQEQLPSRSQINFHTLRTLHHHAYNTDRVIH